MISDSDLANRVVSTGDTDALGDLYQRHAPAIHDFLLRTTRDPALAEDLTQMTFLKAFERRAGLRDPSRVRSWLFSIASHTALDEQRQRHPADDIDQRLDLANPAPGPEDQLTSKEAAALVWSAAASLEPRQYAVLDLTVRQQLTTPEVAAVLGIDPGHAAVLVSRAKEALGNAVRYLLVARRRTHCPTLSAMVPAGVRELTPEQRTSVDHHMRHCVDCRTMASALTRPVEILGGIATIGLPRTLQPAPGTSLPPTLHAQLTGARSLPGATARPAPHRQPMARIIRRGVTHKALAVAAGVVLIAAAGGLALAHALPGRPAEGSSGSAPSTQSGTQMQQQVAVWSAPTAIDTETESSYLRPPAISCASSKWCVAVDGNANAIVYAGSSWASPLAIDPGGHLESVSCPTSNLCVALDTSGNAVVFNGHSWASPTAIFGSVSGGTIHVSLSCPTPTFCAAVDRDDGTIVTFNGRSWSAPIYGPANSGLISCWSRTTCMVGTAVETYNGHSWSASAETGWSSELSVSCPSSRFCSAVDATVLSDDGGSRGTVVDTYDGDSWSVSSPFVLWPDTGNGEGAISCTSSSFCVAIAGSQAALFDGGLWSMPKDIDRGMQLMAVSCASTNFCAVLVFGGDVLTMREVPADNNATPTWSGPIAVDDGVSLRSVSCPSSTFCAAVGDGGIVTYNGRSWSEATVPNSDSDLGSVSCPTITFCVAWELYGGEVMTYNGHSWSSPAAPILGIEPAGCPLEPFCTVLADFSAPLLGVDIASQVSCPTASFCAVFDGSSTVTLYNGTSRSTVHVHVDGEGGPFTCASSSLCVLVSYSGTSIPTMMMYKGRSWSIGILDVGTYTRGDNIRAVSCSSDDFCAAVDQFGQVMTYDGTSWSVPTQIGIDGSLDSGPSSISCAAGPFCVAVDPDGYVYRMPW